MLKARDHMHLVLAAMWVAALGVVILV